MNDKVIDQFVHEARAYCLFVESASGFSLDERLRKARLRLLHLYAAALSLALLKRFRRCLA